MNIVDIAQVCHRVNRAYCKALGDHSQVPWESASQEQRESAVDGVDFHLAHPDAKPEDSHINWLKLKLNQGWKPGKVKDEALKTHPCCIPFDELPTEQKAKDFIFREIVHSLRGWVK